MTTAAQNSPAVACAVNRLVPLVHVGVVEASLDFYALLGFVPQNVMRDAQGRAFWALAQSGTAEIMLARASGPVDADQQAVLFYMYSTDVAALRRHLLASGVNDAGAYRGVKSPSDAPRVVFEVAHPDYMRAGELRLADPDGYVILVGQLS
jgi:hypothetical protein